MRLRASPRAVIVVIASVILLVATVVSIAPWESPSTQGAAVTTSPGATAETTQEAAPKPVRTVPQGGWTIKDLGTLGGEESEAIAINERGEIVGSADTKAKDRDGPIHHAFLWRGGEMSDLGARPGLPQSAAVAINDRGQVVVVVQRTMGAASAPSRAYLWEKGRMRGLGPSSGKSSVALAINERGQVIGCIGSQFSDYPYLGCYGARSFVWEQGRRTDLGTLGGQHSWASAINNRGQIVGWAETNTKGKYGLLVEHAFLWEKGDIRDLGTLGGKESGAAAINDTGQIVGGANTKSIRRLRDYYEYNSQISRAFFWQSGKVVALGTLGGPDSNAAAVNRGGQVIGSADTTTTAGGDRHTPEAGFCGDGKYSHPAPHAFVWANGQITDLGTLGGLESEAVAINDKGQVVGWADTKRSDSDDCPVGHAFVWENGKMSDLGTLGGLESEAVAINNRGQIIGWAETKSGDRHAVLWTLTR